MKVKANHKWSNQDWNFLITYLGENWNQYEYADVLIDLQNDLGVSEGALKTALKSFYLINMGIPANALKGGHGANYGNPQKEAFIKWNNKNGFSRNKINLILNK
tara:strand:- start:15 stop:326 length:312 start_codon:yes stop_codon:yes gene_type:complete